jgi:hypothetical protein
MVRAMHRLLLSDSSSLDRVCDFFRAAHVAVDAESSSRVSVHVPGAATAAHELSEISGYVTTWNALNPGLRIDLKG